MKKFKIDDYSSFSSTTNELQGDKLKGSLAILFFNDLENEQSKEIEKLEKLLEKKRTLKALTNKAILNIDEHLKLKKPFIVHSNNGTYLINEELKTEKVEIVGV